MPQFARPIADMYIGNWTDQTLGIIDLWDTINEATLDLSPDLDYIQSEQLIGDVGFTGSAIAFQLTTPLDNPDVSEGFSFFIRTSKDLPGGQEVDTVAELRQDYVNEADPGVLISTFEIFNLTENPTDREMDIDSAEAALITNFSSLFLRFIPRIGVE